MKPEPVDGIDAISSSDWNRFCDSNPFVNWHFLAAMESTQAANTEQGWTPHHFVLKNALGQIRALMPCYRKMHSHGDFVYDWGMARAVENAGLAWYPKLVAGIPYSPVTSARLLRAPFDTEAAQQLASQLIESCQKQKLLTAQILFPPRHDAELLREAGFLVRHDFIQFHWYNRDYESFENFLDQLRHKKRKQIRQERRKLIDANVQYRWVDAHTASAEELAFVHRCYSKTFLEYGNLPVLTQHFFQLIGEALPGQLLFCIAQQKGRDIAAAVYFRSDECLYGRYWGCIENLPGLHFEVCYYQGIEYCIEHQLQRFEPGVHGEHKVSRGFLPAPTISAHYFSYDKLAAAARSWLGQEQDWMRSYRNQVIQRSPYHPEITDDLLARSGT